MEQPGLVGGAMPQQPEQPMPEQPEQPEGGDDMDPAALRAKMETPGPMADQLDKIVLAGMKVMFDPKTHNKMAEVLDSPAPVPEKLGQGVAGLMGLLMEQSQRSLPPQLLIPAGMVLMAHAADFMKKSGEPVSKEDFGAGVENFVDTMLSQAGMDPAKVASFAERGAGKPEAPQEGMTDGG